MGDTKPLLVTCIKCFQKYYQMFSEILSNVFRDNFQKKFFCISKYRSIKINYEIIVKAFLFNWLALNSIELIIKYSGWLTCVH